MRQPPQDVYKRQVKAYVTATGADPDAAEAMAERLREAAAALLKA